MFFDVFADLCLKMGVSPNKACIEMGLNRSAVAKWKSGGVPNGVTISKMSEYFGVSTDFLLGNQEQKETPALTPKDERDIAKKLDDMLSQLGSANEALMFDGEPLDDETRELLRDSLKNQLEMTKRMAKQKYTPKKYRK